MGLLDQILGGARGGVPGSLSPRSSSGVGSGILMALLPVVISMLSNRGSGAGTAGGLGGSGGLGSILGMGGFPGGDAGGTGGIGAGGLGSLIEQFTHKGYGAQANSWISSGPNEALPAHAVTDVFGDDQISQIAQQAGVSTDDARHGLSELLPGMVDHFTPQGELPGLEHMSASVEEFIRRMDSQVDNT